jgi:hypothetical protein
MDSLRLAAQRRQVDGYSQARRNTIARFLSERQHHDAQRMLLVRKKRADPHSKEVMVAAAGFEPATPRL